MRTEEEVRSVRDRLKSTVDRLNVAVESVRPRSELLYLSLKIQQESAFGSVYAALNTLTFVLGEQDNITNSKLPTEELLKQLEERLTKLETEVEKAKV